MKKNLIITCLFLTMLSSAVFAQSSKPDNLLTTVNAKKSTKKSMFDKGNVGEDFAVLPLGRKKYYLPNQSKAGLEQYTFRKFDASYLTKYLDENYQRIAKNTDFLIVENCNNFKVKPNTVSSAAFYYNKEWPYVVLIAENLQNESLSGSDFNAFNAAIIGELAHLKIAERSNSSEDINTKNTKWEKEVENIIYQFAPNKSSSYFKAFQMQYRKFVADVTSATLKRSSFNLSESDPKEKLSLVLKGKELDLFKIGQDIKWEGVEYKKKTVGDFSAQIIDSSNIPYSDPVTIQPSDNWEEIITKINFPTEPDDYVLQIQFYNNKKTIPFTVYSNDYFSKTNIPSVFELSQKGQTVNATVKGNSFKQSVSQDFFTVTCPENPSLAEKAIISVANAKTLNFSFSVPDKVGKYTITISAGESSISKTINVLKSKTIKFGSWPQTIAKSGVKFTATSETFGDFPVFNGSDGAKYVEVKAKPFDESTKYSNGKTIAKDSADYFKIEPIEWRILSIDDDGNYTVASTKILASNVPYYGGEKSRKIKGKDVAPNNYKYSNIRAYLNGISNPSLIDGLQNPSEFDLNWSNKGFLQTAFSSEEQEKILVTVVDNSATSTSDMLGKTIQAVPQKMQSWNNGLIRYYGKDFTSDNTEDKIFLLSENEVTSGFYSTNETLGKYYSLNKDRQYPVCDFALANGCWISSTQNGCNHVGFGWWWLRSPKSQLDNRVRGVQAAGDASFYFHTSYSFLGIVPAMRIPGTE